VPLGAGSSWREHGAFEMSLAGGSHKRTGRGVGSALFKREGGRSLVEVRAARRLRKTKLHQAVANIGAGAVYYQLQKRKIK